MSTDLLHQIDRLEKACHAAHERGDDAATIAFLMCALDTVKLKVTDEERPVVKGLANMVMARADMLLHALSTDAAPAVVHSGLDKLCNLLTEFREAITGEPAVVASRRNAE